MLNSSLQIYLFLSLSVILFFGVIQLFEYTLYAPSRSTFSPPAASAAYRLVDTHAGASFFDGFNYEDAPDPTHGHVRYLSKRDALAANLTYTAVDGTSYIHSDSTSRAPSGRPSIRLSSKKSYTRGLFVLDVLHMPEGCATWPAFWTTAVSAWPRKGEIDILEGVNLETSNAFTLHTGPGCRMAEYRAQRGHSESMNCDVQAWNQWPNQGCGVKTPDSFGSAMNAAGGAVVVMEWTKSVIRMWLFPRDEVPFDLAVDAPKSSVEDWGLPHATFDAAECDIEGIFRDHVLIINTTFCGDWAGQVYGQSECPGSDCREYVTNHPEAFTEAYWAIKSLKVYQLVIK